MVDKQIVFLVNSLKGGGAERVISRLGNYLIDDYEVFLILLENEIDYDLNDKIKIICLNEKIEQIGIVKFIRLPIIAYKLGCIIKKYKFKKVISFLYRANYVNILSNYFIKHNVVISERIAPSSMYKEKSINSFISKILIKYLYNKSDLIITVSKAISNDLFNTFNIRTNKEVIYNPYEIEKIIQLSKEDINIEISKKSIISVGSLNKRKNHKLLIKAFKNIIDIEYKLYILGKGEDEIYLKNLVKTMNLENRVIFLGFDNNPYKYLSKAEIFVLSSNSEGFPNVLVEAMICGCNIISTDCLSGPREILSPNTDCNKQLKNQIELGEYGVLTPINDIGNMRKAIDLLIEDKILKDKYKDKLLKRVRDFDIDKIINKYKEVICVES